ncbi:MAG: ATP-binding protein [Chthoniobacteraceae bacterium]|jgi:signal transduction histidine kinase
MPNARPSRLWLSIAWPFFLFVVTGSIVLVLWMQAAARRESQAVFTALARTNAHFLHDAHVPATEQMMGYLARMLNVQAYLRSTSTIVPDPHGLASELAPLDPAQGVVALDRNFEGVAMTIQPGLDLILVRPTESAYLFLWRPETLVVLGVFWLLSVALAWSIARGVVQPIRLLARRLPHIESDPAGTLPGTERRDELGDLARAYLAARDQIVAEREKRRQAERMALLGRMATSLAHEIHNPLSAIRMHAQLLQSAPPADLPAAAADFVPTLLDETGRIESLVNQWMFLTRPEPPSMSAINLARIVAQTVRAQSAAAAYAGVTLKTNIAPDLAVMGDARRLSQAIANTILNAIQAMPHGGSLEITETQESSSAALAFHDTGPGFSPEALRRHRELFFSEKEGGMGIGLSVTAEILEAHGGSLDVANAPAGGALVTFHLPSII